VRNDPDVTPEDKEAWLLDREKDDDALLDFQKVERVIGTQDGEEGTEYFIKCRFCALINNLHCSHRVQGKAFPMMDALGSPQLSSASLRRTRSIATWIAPLGFQCRGRPSPLRELEHRIRCSRPSRITSSMANFGSSN
jgi:hypothetical protein